MADDWCSVPLGDLVELRKGVSYKGDFLDKPGPRLLGLGTISLGGGLVFDKAMPYGGPVREHQRAYPGDLLLAVVGITPVGSVIGSPAIVPKEATGEFAFTHHVAKATLREKGRLDPRFLYYALRAPAFQAYVWQMQFGSTVPEISLTDVLSYQLRLPGISSQRAIAHILGTLDDKIELNRKMSETLEEMARALFTEWFASPAASPGGASDNLAEKYRADTREGEFSELAQLSKEQDDPRAHQDEWFDHYSIPAFDAGLRPVKELGKGIKSTKFRVPPGSVLLSKLNPEIDRTWLVDVTQQDRAIASTEFLVLVPRAPCTAAFLYCTCRSLPIRQILVGLVTGTSKSHQRAQPADVMRMPVVVPSRDAVASFERVAGPLLQRAQVARRESWTLGELRDALLPQLISGELRVKDAERFVQEAM